MYFKLIKVLFKENFSLAKILGTDPKRNKGKAILMIALLVYALGAFLMMFGWMFFDLAETLNQFGMINVLLIYAFIYATMLSIMFVLFRSNGYIFNYKDYELLEPLPIKNRTVLMAKTTVMLIFILLGVYAFMVPIMFSFYYHGGFNVWSFLIFLIATLSVPIIPTVLFSFVSLLIARLTSKFRKTNILNIVFLFIVFLGIMYLSVSFSSFTDANPLLNQQEFMNEVGSVYPPIKWYVAAVNDLDVLNLLILLGANAAIFAGFVFGIQKLVLSTNQRAMTKVTRKTNKKVVAKKTPIMFSIANKESKKFFNTPIYALNIGFGPIILIVLGVASLFYADEIMAYLGEEMNLGVGFEAMILILFGFSLSMIYSTAVSLSLEGKNFWIIKSLPIEPKKVMYGKMLFNLILSIPAAVLALILFSFSLEFSFGLLMMMLLFIVSMSLMVTVFGSIINLYFPKFSFRNPAEVVKQSAGALFALFGSWILLVLNGVIFYFVTKSMSTEIALLLMSLFCLTLFALMLIFVDKKSETLFMKYEV